MDASRIVSGILPEKFGKRLTPERKYEKIEKITICRYLWICRGAAPAAERTIQPGKEVVDVEDSRLIPGICPQCGGRLQIPAELRHFSCLYCGARLDLAELLPEPSQTERVPAAEAQEAYDFAAAHLPECVTAYPRALRHLTKGEFEPYFQEYRTACRPVCQRIPAAAQAMPQQGSEAALTALSDGFLTQLEAWLVRQKKGRSGRDALLDDMKFTICLFLIPCIRLENSPACEDFCRILQEQWLERYPAKPFRLTTYPDILQGFQRRKLCFITTAACSRLGKPDDGPELTAFRSFRDGYLQAQPDGPQLIAQYYDWAPGITMAIELADDPASVYPAIWNRYLSPCYAALQRGDAATCKAVYTQMVRELAAKYLAVPANPEDAT